MPLPFDAGEKKKAMMKKHFVPILLGLLLFACVAGLALESNRAQQAEAALEEIYQSALMETTEQMQALSLALEKVLELFYKEQP